jgi:uncharacterized protein
MIEFGAAFVVGLLGSLHCLGMCGPLILAYSLQVRGGLEAGPLSDAASASRGLSHHLGFHAGRLLTYGLLGAAGAVFFGAAEVEGAFQHLRALLTIAGGAAMILLGSTVLKVLPIPAVLLELFAPSSAWAHACSRLLRSRFALSRVLLGAGVGFLPCGLSWAMVAKAATSSEPLSGFGTMVAFGLGTVPVLLLPGFGASFLTLQMRILGERAAAASVMAMGAMLLYQGIRSVG